MAHRRQSWNWRDVPQRYWAIPRTRGRSGRPCIFGARRQGQRTRSRTSACKSKPWRMGKALLMAQWQLLFLIAISRYRCSWLEWQVKLLLAQRVDAPLRREKWWYWQVWARFMRLAQKLLVFIVSFHSKQFKFGFKPSCFQCDLTQRQYSC
jgi:hypothetical protein